MLEGVIAMAKASKDAVDQAQASGRVEPRRLRWSVPRADVSTNRWLDLQNDISHSLQLLIRESIQRDGYVDVVNRPVEQLPRRSRRPQTESADDFADAVGNGDGGEDSPSAQAVSTPEPQADAGTDDAEVHEPREEAADAVEAPAPAPQAQPAPKQGGSGLDAFLT